MVVDGDGGRWRWSTMVVVMVLSVTSAPATRPTPPPAVPTAHGALQPPPMRRMTRPEPTLTEPMKPAVQVALIAKPAALRKTSRLKLSSGLLASPKTLSEWCHMEVRKMDDE